MVVQRSNLKVVLDVGPAVHQKAGLSRYTNRLTSQLVAGHREHLDASLFYNRHSGHELPRSLQEAKSRTISLGQYAWRLSVLASQVAHLSLYERLVGEYDLYHATEHLLPHLRCPTILTVHDLIFERYPQHHTYRNRLFLKVGMPLFVKAATAIIAVSQYTKRELIELYGTPAQKIHVIYQGIDAHFAPTSSDETHRIRVKYSPDRPYLLMVGTLEPRKNHAAAMHALARLKADGFPHRLVIAGGQGWLFEPIRVLVQELGLQEDVHFAGYVPAIDLPALYTGADCLLQPSLSEGFGFPVLEAMACGTPVICSQTSSLPEAAGDAALLINPEDVQALVAAISRVLTEPDLAQTMRAKGIAHAAHFRWDQCAQQTVELYRNVVNGTL